MQNSSTCLASSSYAAAIASRGFKNGGKGYGSTTQSKRTLILHIRSPHKLGGASLMSHRIHAGLRAGFASAARSVVQSSIMSLESGVSS